jgi:hypothetical protein
LNSFIAIISDMAAKDGPWKIWKSASVLMALVWRRECKLKDVATTLTKERLWGKWCARAECIQREKKKESRVP